MNKVEILRTKFYIPPSRPNLVSRRRLLQRLNAGSDGKLILLSAPAGFGKTTLLGEWVKQCKRPVAWISLDEADNAPVRFMVCLLSSMQTSQAKKGTGKEILSALHSPQPPALEGVATMLLNELAQAEVPLVFVLDDYHLITEELVHQSAFFMINNMPPGILFVISGRSDPPWPLARLRGQQEMTEIRARDLRFGLEETRELLNDVMKLNLSNTDLSRLEEHTEGWIVGLQMAALSLKGQENASALVQSFTSSNRFVIDYLVEEVLAHQTPEVKEFLFKTSILERFSPPLCDAVLGRQDSFEIIRYLDQANLFITSLDDERQWYCYHKLFHEMLRTYLRRQYPSAIVELHNRASLWFAEKGLVIEAVRYAVAAGNTEHMVALVERHALEMIFQQELNALIAWLDILPEAIIRSRPWLCVAYAWTYVNVSQLENAERYLIFAEKKLPLITGEEKNRLLGHINAIRAYALGQRGEFQMAAAHQQKALSLLPEFDPARGWCAVGVAHCLRRLGDLPAAERAYYEAIAANEAAGDEQNYLQALTGLATVQAMSGRLRQAASAYREILALADQYTQQGKWFPITGDVHAALCSILREWNDLEGALEHARAGVESMERWGQLDFLLFGYIELAFTLQAVGDSEGAKVVFEKIDGVVAGLPDWPMELLEADRLRWLLERGEVAEAVSRTHNTRFNPADEINFQFAYQYIVLARVLMAETKFAQAERLLDRLLALEEAAGASRRVVELLILKSVTLDAQGRIHQSMQTVERALEVAEPEGYVRSFLNQGKAMEHVLQTYLTRGSHTAYAARLLAAFAKQPEQIQRRQSQLSAGLTARLSKREVEVLRLLGEGLTNDQIAETLFLATGTIKKHLKNIYHKLDVHNRTAAVVRARELDLI